eukprot:EG_transcript_7457
MKDEAITITIADIAVEGLSVADGIPSPYVSVRVGTVVHETVPRRHCSHATWPDSFTFAVTCEDTLYLTVWDDARAENIGELWMTARELVADWRPGQGGRAALTASLKGPHGHAGIVMLNVLAVDRLAAMLSARLPAAAAASNSLSLSPSALPATSPRPPAPADPARPIAAKVTVLGAQGLDTLCSDPSTYVAIREGTIIRRTNTCPHMANPVWNAEFVVTLDAEAILCFEVVQEGPAGNHVLADFSVAATEVTALAESTGRFGVKYTLRGRHGDGCGVLAVRFERVDPAVAASPPAAAPPRRGAVEGRLVPPVVRHASPPPYVPLDVDGGCAMCQCGGSRPEEAKAHKVSFLRPGLLDPTATWELSVGVQGAFLTTSSTGNVFATVRCGRQYHKTAVRALVRGEVVWDEPFDLQFGPTDALELAVLTTDGASIRAVGSATMRRADLTSMVPLHEVWLQVKSPAGRPAGEVLLSVDAARKAATPARSASHRSVRLDPTA